MQIKFEFYKQSLYFFIFSTVKTLTNNSLYHTYNNPSIY